MPDVLIVIHDVHGDGVAATKNRGITALIDAGCQHLFLADDDIWPITPNWAQPYTDDPEPHLMHCWGTNRYVRTINNHYTTWKTPNGVMLYTHRSVIERVGGMRPEYGRWGGEHAEWSRRIHKAGLTTYRYADLTIARNNYWHAEDRGRNIKSSITPEERQEYFQTRYHTLRKRFNATTDYVEYRTP
ncbi:glycosyltransferase family 2 protein [Mycobacterium marinum]|uniref:glycosyltransferase family 2 protein n=1 Tax=Mycobacterium marinum TaxID=1781 RepID=UPI0011406A66|nr:galactosyltransferase-related protein [Mycobacterium marinum]